MNIRNTAVSAAAMLVMSGMASASIVSTSGDALKIAQPGDARFNQLTSSTQVYVWDESQDFALTGSVHANAQAPGLYNQFGDLQNIVIAAEQHVASHFIHFDSPGSQAERARGTVTFDSEILGVIAVNEENQRDLDNSDFLGAPTLFSHGNSNRGLEFSATGDRFSISPDGKTIEFNFSISSPGDYMRVVTKVPTPGSIALLGASGLIATRRRRA